LANEHRGFKFWSENQKARTTGEERCFACEGAGRFIYPDEFVDGHTYAEGCAECQGAGWIPTDKNPLLEEYVDCLHFILSIGLELGAEKLFANEVDFNIGTRTITKPTLDAFDELFNQVSLLSQNVKVISFFRYDVYSDLFSTFTTLGDSLGFTENQIEQAYFEKNKINHERQESGY